MNRIAATNLKFKRSSSTLDGILSYQRWPLVNTGLGYDKEETTEDFKLPEKKTEEKSRSWAEILKSLKHGEERKKEDSQTHQDKKYSLEQGISSHLDQVRRRPFFPQYERVFFGYCYSCNEFVHRAINCVRILSFNQYDLGSYLR